MSETLAYLIDQTALRLDTKKAILFVRGGSLESQITYSTLKIVSDRVANGLMEMGLNNGERAILFMPKSIEKVLLHLAIQKVGAISVILNPRFKRNEMEYFIEDTDPVVLIVGKDEEALIRSISKKRRIISIDTASPFTEDKLFPLTSGQPLESKAGPDDPAILIYTSGTTGQPKGAILTHRNLTQDARNIIQIWKINEADVLCHALPLFHIHGLCFALHTSLIAGAKIVMVEEFLTQHVLDVLARQEGETACTIFMGVPTMYVKLTEKLEPTSHDFSHLRLLTSGSAPLLPRDFKKIEKLFGKEPVEREGMSETGMNFSNPLQGPRKPGSIGLPLPNVEVRIVDPESLRDVESGEAGEIWLKGPNITPGYWRKTRETEKAFINGWFRTGDLGKKDESGYYYITDRLKHIIISGGENISPKEIENVLNGHLKISESCVVGVPDEKWGEMVIAAVVPKPGVTITAEEIKHYCRIHMLDWKCPKELFFMEEIPRNKMGKVLKEEVVRLFLKKTKMETP